MVARTPAWNPGSTDVPPRLPCLDRLACADEGDRIAVPRCCLLARNGQAAAVPARQLLREEGT